VGGWRLGTCREIVIVIKVTCVHILAINLHMQLSDNRATDVLDLMKEKGGCAKPT
jgi:hypothetical protein